MSDTEVLGYDELVAHLKEYVEKRFLPGGESGLQANTPLLESGILSSLKTTELITHIREEFGLFVPPDKIVGSNFKNLDAIAKMVEALQADPMARI